MTVLVRKAMPVSRSIWLAASIGGMLVLSAASHGYAAPQVGGARVELAEAIVHTVQGRAHDKGTLYRPPQTIKSPPGPKVRDHRQGGSKTTSSAQGGVLVDGKEGKVKRPPSCGLGGLCGHDPKSTVRDHRFKGGCYGCPP